MNNPVDCVQAINVKFEGPKGLVLKSNMNSLDVNDHIKELTKSIASASISETHGGCFQVYYVGRRLFAGDGPQYNQESIRAIARLKSSINDEIYCTCTEI
jgi:hypothetical protein